MSPSSCPGSRREGREDASGGAGPTSSSRSSARRPLAEEARLLRQIGVRELLLVDRKPWSLELYRLDGGELKLVGKIAPTRPSISGQRGSASLLRLLPGDPRPSIEVTQTEDARTWLDLTGPPRSSRLPDLPMNAAPTRSSIFGAMLAVTLGPAAEAASPRLTGVRPLGGQRGTELEVDFTGQRLGTPRRSSSISRGSRRPTSRRRRQPHQGDGQGRGRLPRSGPTTSGSGRPPGSANSGPSASGRSRDDRGRAQRRVRHAPEDRVRLGRQRRGPDRGRRLLRLRGEEGGPDHRRGRGGPAGDRPLRPLRRDPGLEAVRAGLQRRRRPDLAGRVRLGRRPGATGPTSSRSARAPTPAPTPASIGSTSATSPGRRRPSPPAASSARRSTSGCRRRPRREDPPGHAARRAEARVRHRRPRRARGRPPTPTPSGSPPSAT